MESLRGAQIRVRHFFLRLQTPILCIESHVRNRGATNIESVGVVVAPHNRIAIVACRADALSSLHDAAVDTVQVLGTFGNANVRDEAPPGHVAVLGLLQMYGVRA